MKVIRNKLLVMKLRRYATQTLTLLMVTINVLLPGTQRTAIAQEVPPVLEFPEMELDDTSTYRGYTTRFFHEPRRNTTMPTTAERE